MQATSYVVAINIRTKSYAYVILVMLLLSFMSVLSHEHLSEITQCNS